MFKPAFPYLKDAVNHLMFFKQHMATVHFENGKYHVHAEVTKNAQEENSNKSIPTSKKENTSTDHIVNKISEGMALIPSTFPTYLLYNISGLLLGNPYSHYPPPRI